MAHQRPEGPHLAWVDRGHHPRGLAIGLYVLIRHRTWQPLALLAATAAGAIGLYDIVKPPIGQPPPPAAIWIGHYTGAAFPSGHTTQSAAFYPGSPVP
jgi:membrane-associated phospholipid phosphatase